MNAERSSNVDLPGRVSNRLKEFSQHLRDVLGDALVFVVACGPITKGQVVDRGNATVNAMLVLSEVTTGLLDRAAALVRQDTRDLRLAATGFETR